MKIFNKALQYIVLLLCLSSAFGVDKAETKLKEDSFFLFSRLKPEQLEDMKNFKENDTPKEMIQKEAKERKIKHIIGLLQDSITGRFVFKDIRGGAQRLNRLFQNNNIQHGVAPGRTSTLLVQAYQELFPQGTPILQVSFFRVP